MADRVIWERVIDYDKIEKRKQRFLQLFIGPALLIVLLVFVLGGVANAIGAAILVGAVGLAWRTTVRYQSLSDQANPTMTYDGTHIRVGDRSVAVRDVKCYATWATSIQTSLLGRFSRIDLCKAVFRTDEPGTRRDPQFVEFGWPNMDETGVEGIAAALRPILGTRQVEPAELLSREEAKAASRRRGRPSS